jgi:hypothetical protein
VTVTFFLARLLTGAAPQEIGREFGGRHHTTVLHSISKIDQMRRSEKALDRTITRLVDAFAPSTSVSLGAMSARGNPRLVRRFLGC